MQRDAETPKVAVSELSLCTINSIAMLIMLGLIIGLKCLFEGKTYRVQCRWKETR